MQTLDIISVNLWQILISLLNLVILFLILRHFLFKPVKKVMAERQKEIDQRYDAADHAEAQANERLNKYEAQLADAGARADAIIQNAEENAKHHAGKLVAEAQERADGIIRAAQNEAELEKKKAADTIKQEIVEVSGALTEKMLEREINVDDHRSLIDSFIEKLGDDND